MTRLAPYAFPAWAWTLRICRVSAASAAPFMKHLEADTATVPLWVTPQHSPLRAGERFGPRG